MFSALYFHKTSITAVVHKLTADQPLFSPVNYCTSFKSVENQTQWAHTHKKSQQYESMQYFNFFFFLKKRGKIIPAQHHVLSWTVWNQVATQPQKTRFRGWETTSSYFLKAGDCGKSLATVPRNLASKHKLSGPNFHLTGTSPFHKRALMCV